MDKDLVADVSERLEQIEKLPPSEQPDAYRELQRQLERVLENNED